MIILKSSIVTQPPETARARFRRLRRDTNFAFLDWLRERPDPTDVADETAASIHAFRHLATAAAAGDAA